MEPQAHYITITYIILAILMKSISSILGSSMIHVNPDFSSDWTARQEHHNSAMMCCHSSGLWIFQAHYIYSMLGSILWGYLLPQYTISILMTYHYVAAPYCMVWLKNGGILMVFLKYAACILWYANALFPVLSLVEAWQLSQMSTYCCLLHGDHDGSYLAW